MLSGGLTVEDLSVCLAEPQPADRLPLVRNCTLEIAPGVTTVLVGASGCGKTTLLRSLMRLLPDTLRVSGRVLWHEDGQQIDVLRMRPRALRRLRGAAMGWIAQEPSAALNPRLTAGGHLREAARAHGRGDAAASVAALEAVGLPASRARQYPFEWSGGMQQRLLIAMALVQRPRILLADEFSSALDAENQRQLIDLLQRLSSDHGLGLCVATHDLSLAAEIGERVLVMRAGQIVDRGGAEILRRPRVPYTAMLANCQPPSRPPTRSARAGPPRPALLEFRDVSASLGGRQVLEGINFALPAGATMTLVGPSGAGKSTIARLALGLIAPDRGSIWYDGQRVDQLGEDSWRRLRGDIQAVFQDPQRSLDPTQTVAHIIAEGLEVQGRAPERWRARRRWRAALAESWMQKLGLPMALAGRRPRQLSGGEKQRVALARALALGPRLLVADEPLAALDAATGAAIVELWRRARAEGDLTGLWVSHHLGQAAAMADLIGVVEAGRLVELAAPADLLRASAHPCTRRLLAAAPSWPPLERAAAAPGSPTAS